MWSVLHAVSIIIPVVPAVGQPTADAVVVVRDFIAYMYIGNLNTYRGV